MRGEDFIQLKGHDLALVREVEDGVVVRVEAQHGFGIGGVLLLLTDRPDATEHTDVTLETKYSSTVNLEHFVLTDEIISCICTGAQTSAR